MRTLPIDPSCPTYDYFYDAFDNQKWHTHILLIAPNGSARLKHALQILLNHPQCVPNINSNWNNDINDTVNNWAYFGLPNNAFNDTLTADYGTRNYNPNAEKFIASKFGHLAQAKKIIKSFNATDIFKMLVFKPQFDIDSITDFLYDSFCHLPQKFANYSFTKLEQTRDLQDFYDCSVFQSLSIDYNVLAEPSGAEQILDVLNLDNDDQLIANWINFVTNFNQQTFNNNITKDQIKQVVEKLMTDY